MIIFLHGADSFRSRQKLNALIEQFKKQRDPGGNNVVKIDGTKLSIDELNSKIAPSSLLAEKRLLVIEDLFNHKEENIFKSLLTYLQKSERAKNENVLIFYEGRELDSKKYGEKKLTATRKKFFDYLKKQKFSEQFNPLNNIQTANWIKDYISSQNIKINPTTINLIINLTSADLWVLHNELNKLINFVQAQKRNEITTYDVQQFIHGAIDDNIFALTDAISNKNKALFFMLLENQLEAGSSIQQILAMLIRQFKIILQIKELLIQSSTIQDITSQLKLHPYVVQKTIPQTRNFSLDYLKNILSQLVNIDYKTKTGQADGLTSLNLLFAI